MAGSTYPRLAKASTISPILADTSGLVLETAINRAPIALHHLPNGAVWPVEAIMEHKAQIEAAGLKWEVVESLPVTEAIKLQSGPWKQHIEQYQQSLSNLARCSIRTVTYNFMPVLDWTRTHLDSPLPNGAQALSFESSALAAFDLFIAQRKNTAEDYSPATRQRAEAYYRRMNEKERASLAAAILSGLPGAEASYTLAAFRAAVHRYQHVRRGENLASGAGETRRPYPLSARPRHEAAQRF